jgi:Protein of unknown function (DUF2927)
MAALFLGLAACDPAALGGTTPPPTPDAAQPARPQASAASQALSRYYQEVEAGFLTQGLLRQDGGGPDVPFTARNLVDNFMRIALFEEYTVVSGRIVARQTPSQLHKWDVPLRMKIAFGASIPSPQRLTDRRNITSYADRLSRISGLPIRQVNDNPNFYVFVVNEDERRALATTIQDILPDIDQATLRAVVDMPRSTFCLVFALDAGETGTYSKALAVIRGEHPDLMRRACIHEELAQGLGLSNDSPAARPSIFNDDEEFALLTTHDELLLRMLYDDRMVPGMDATQARAQAEIIAAELVGGDG